MKKQAYLFRFIAIMFTLSLYGCTTTSPYRATQTGAATGAIVGAAIGHNTKGHNKGKRAAIGGALGAVAGAGIGNVIDNQRQETTDNSGWQ